MRNKKTYRYNMKVHFSAKLWDLWLAKLNAVELSANDQQLANGIAHFRTLCAAREKETM